MRKRLALLLSILILGAVFVGCSQPAVEEEQPTVDETAEENEQEVDEAVEEAEVPEEEEVKEMTDVKFEILELEDLDEDMQEEVEELIKEEGLVVLDEENSIVLISVGERPTGGYAVVPVVKKQQDEILVGVFENKPSEDDVVTEAISYPYVIIKVYDDVSNITLVQPQEENAEEINGEDADTPSATGGVMDGLVRTGKSVGVSESFSVGQSQGNDTDNSQGISYSKSIGTGIGNGTGDKKIQVERPGYKPALQ